MTGRKAKQVLCGRQGINPFTYRVKPMQWKGPSDVLATVGPDDYGINMNRKEKSFNASLLKRSTMRDAVSDEAQMCDGSVSAASLAVV
ncbi:hypothetical protein PoB_007692500 [Plakobranchus ocellatus]|uniref:Uncharacterized protein n=1 Tax=Plakobranchus ocellatus TaxID=259542 RepID=A0AAV4E2A4_9GAST|nr:hypothetical protein PoB_007692500 [Plakobranchus ocellatus]